MAQAKQCVRLLADWGCLTSKYILIGLYNHINFACDTCGGICVQHLGWSWLITSDRVTRVLALVRSECEAKVTDLISTRQLFTLCQEKGMIWNLVHMSLIVSWLFSQRANSKGDSPPWWRSTPMIGWYWLCMANLSYTVHLPSGYLT